MKILLQNQYDGLLGGVETYFALIVDALVAQGNEVIAVYTRCGKKKGVVRRGYKEFYLPNLDLAEDAYYSNSCRKAINRDRELLRFIVADEKPDIIHLNNTHYPFEYGFLGRCVPIVQTVHDFYHCCNTVLKLLPDGICSDPAGRACFRNGCISPRSIMELWRFKTKYRSREAMKRFDELFVTTPYMKETLVRSGFREDRIRVVPLFVEDWGAHITNGKNTVVYAGRIAQEKGVIDFLHMLTMLPRSFEAFIIGDGPQREECETLASVMGLNNRVRFTGFLDRGEIREYFERASVVVIPSLWPEPLCLVGLEAMSCAKPVVAYDVGGISSWLADGRNGYLVRRRDIGALALKVQQLLDDKKAAQEMGQKGREVFRARFSQDIHIRNLTAAYETIIASRKKVRRGRRQPLRYPGKQPGEFLPDYNKRLIEFERENNIVRVRSYPEEITISTTIRCNMDPPCVMCERNMKKKEDLQYDIDPEALERLKPIFKYADRIYLHCGGEPLMTDKIFEIIESAAPPTKIIFNTNGALFTEKTISYMVDCSVVDVISFSIDAATEKTYKRIRSADFNRVINNIKGLISYRNARNSDKPLLRPLVLMNFCIFRQNIAEVPDYVTLAHGLGVDGLDFSHLNQGFDWQQKRDDYTFDYKSESVLKMDNYEEHDALVLKAYELGKKYNMPINFNGNPFIAENNMKKYRVKNEISEVIKHKKICNAPWNRVVIETDGRVRMCYFHDATCGTIGKLKSRFANRYHAQSESFDRIWNSPEAVSVREEFIKKNIAQRCVTKNPCIFQDRV